MVRVPASLLLSTLLTTGLVPPLYAQTAPAAQTTPAAPTSAAAAPIAPADRMPADTQRDQAENARSRERAADRAAMFEAHLAAVHAGLTLTPDQEMLWPPVERAMRGVIAMRADVMDRRNDRMQDRADGDADQDPVAALTAYSDSLLERGEALKALSSAAQPLYAALSEEQRHRLPLLMRDAVPQNGPLARIMGRFDQQDEERGDRPQWGMRRRWEQGRFGDWRGSQEADARGEESGRPWRENHRRAWTDGDERDGAFGPRDGWGGRGHRFEEGGPQDD